MTGPNRQRTVTPVCVLAPLLACLLAGGATSGLRTPNPPPPPINTTCRRPKAPQWYLTCSLQARSDTNPHANTSKRELLPFFVTTQPNSSTKTSHQPSGSISSQSVHHWDHHRKPSLSVTPRLALMYPSPYFPKQRSDYVTFHPSPPKRRGVCHAGALCPCNLLRG